MSFRLWTVFYVFALVAAAMATFRLGGIFVAAIVLAVWLAYLSLGRSRAAHRTAALVAFVFLLACILIATANPSVRQAAERSICISNQKEIALAILNYATANGRLPPASVADASGKPMHSWRVLILPYLEGQLALYNKYNFNEPWDGPNNRKLASAIPGVYQCPSQRHRKGTSATETHYLAVVDPETVWPGSVGRRLAEVSDGTAATVSVVEATGKAVHWMAPDDLTLAEAVELLTTPSAGHLDRGEGFLTTTYDETSGRYVSFVDCHVRWLGQFDDAVAARALLTCAGGETISPATGYGSFSRNRRTVVNWGTVYALVLLATLAVLPAFRPARGTRVAARRDL